MLRLEHALAALAVDVVRGVAGKATTSTPCSARNSDPAPARTGWVGVCSGRSRPERRASRTTRMQLRRATGESSVPIARAAKHARDQPTSVPASIISVGRGRLLLWQCTWLWLQR